MQTVSSPPGYFPVKLGSLFSVKAVTASIRSSEGTILELIEANISKPIIDGLADTVIKHFF